MEKKRELRRSLWFLFCVSLFSMVQRFELKIVVGERVHRNLVVITSPANIFSHTYSHPFHFIFLCTINYIVVFLFIFIIII